MTRRAWTVVVVASVAAVYALRLDRVAGLMVDDAWYILLAKALADGDGYRLISSATTPILPAAPPGFPLLLAPVFALAPAFPANLLALKAISVVAMLGVGVATYHYFRDYRRVPDGVAASVAVATVLTPGLVFLATSAVMAEGVFTLAQILTLLLLDQRDRRPGTTDVRRAGLAGLLAAAAVLIRAAGVAVLVAGVLYLLKERRWRHAALFSGAAVAGLLPWSVYSAAHAPTADEAASHGGTIAYGYANLLATQRTGDLNAGRSTVLDLPGRMFRNAVNVAARDIGGVFVPGLFRGADESGQETFSLGRAVGGPPGSMGLAAGTVVVSSALSALVLLGWVTSLRPRMAMAELLVIASMIMICLVPTRTFRYLLPLAPFLWMYLAQGVRALAEAGGRWARMPGADGAAALRVVLLCLFVLQVRDHVEYVVLKANDAPTPNWLADARETDAVLDWMTRNLPAGAPIASTNPGLVYLRTGRKGVASANPGTNWPRWKAAGIRYIVALRPTALPPRSSGYQVLYMSKGRLWVVEI